MKKQLLKWSVQILLVMSIALATSLTTVNCSSSPKSTTQISHTSERLAMLALTPEEAAVFNLDKNAGLYMNCGRTNQQGDSTAGQNVLHCDGWKDEVKQDNAEIRKMNELRICESHTNNFYACYLTIFNRNEKTIPYVMPSAGAPPAAESSPDKTDWRKNRPPLSND